MAKRKILVVEDDPDLGKLTRLRLVHSGFDVLVVPDALLGVQEANQYKPDLVILDLMLPAGGGMTVLKGLKSSVYTMFIPVLVMTALERECDPAIFEAMEKIGIEGFLKKPFESNHLVEETRRILREHCPDAASDQPQAGL